MIIYLITNIVNGKTYVGQHCGESDSRWKQHLAAALKLENPLPLYRAMRKYGAENFKYEVLEEVPLSKGPKFLDEREIYWIKEKKSYISQNGYNLTEGGQGIVGYYCSSSRNEKLSTSLDRNNYGAYDPITGKLVKIYEKSKDLKAINIWPGHALKCSSWHTGGKTTTTGGKVYPKTAGGFMWLVLGNGEVFPEFINPLGNRTSGNYGKKKAQNQITNFESDKEIAQYSLSGYLIDTFVNNMREVERLTGVSYSSIRLSILGKNRMGGGYQWRIFPKGESPDKIESEIVPSELKFSKRELTSKPVMKFLDDREIFTYKSIIDAVLDNNLKPTDILSSIETQSEDPKGFNWRWKS
jgi:group I intron endonuclease